MSVRHHVQELSQSKQVLYKTVWHCCMHNKVKGQNCRGEKQRSVCSFWCEEEDRGRWNMGHDNLQIVTSLHMFLPFSVLTALGSDQSYKIADAKGLKGGVPWGGARFQHMRSHKKRGVELLLLGLKRWFKQPIWILPFRGGGPGLGPPPAPGPPSGRAAEKQAGCHCDPTTGKWEKTGGLKSNCQKTLKIWRFECQIILVSFTYLIGRNRLHSLFCPFL